MDSQHEVKSTVFYAPYPEKRELSSTAPYLEKRELSSNDNSTQSESRDSCEDTLSEVSSTNLKRQSGTDCPIFERLHQLSLERQLDGKKKRSAIQKAREEREAHRNGEMMKHKGTISLSQASEFYERCMQSKLERDMKIARAEELKRDKETNSVKSEGTIPLEQATRLHYIPIGRSKVDKEEKGVEGESEPKLKGQRTIPLKQVTRLHYMTIGNHRRKKSTSE